MDVKERIRFCRDVKKEYRCGLPGHDGFTNKEYWSFLIVRLNTWSANTCLFKQSKKNKKMSTSIPSLSASYTGPSILPAKYTDPCSPLILEGPKLDVGTKYLIAVKELIIEWTDYQSEFSGCVHCEACEDPLLNSGWFLNDYADSNLEFNENDENGYKRLLRFVKPPGRKMTFVNIEKDELQFFPIDLQRCIPHVSYTSSVNKQTKGIVDLECEIRSLFDKNELLPIKNAHMTVEIIIK